MCVSVQESLLDMADEPVLSVLGSTVRRRPLSRGAWVDLRPGWLTGSGAVFNRLLETVPWRAEKRHMYDRVVAVPRLLCFYGEDAPLPDPVLTAAREALDAHYGPELGEPFAPRACAYTGTADSVAWHGDTIGRGRTEDTMVAILSLGTPRPLVLRPRARDVAAVEPGHGDLLVMGGSCQRTWEHAVPKTSQPAGRGSACSSAARVR